MSFALKYVLGASFSDEAEVRLLYKNLMQREPTASEIAYWGDKLAAGELSQQSLAVMAGDSSANAVNINLVGLMEVGLEYS